jgi:hypothetical protein
MLPDVGLGSKPSINVKTMAKEHISSLNLLLRGGLYTVVHIRSRTLAAEREKNDSTVCPNQRCCVYL